MDARTILTATGVVLVLVVLAAVAGVLHAYLAPLLSPSGNLSSRTKTGTRSGSSFATPRQLASITTDNGAPGRITFARTETRTWYGRPITKYLTAHPEHWMLLIAGARMGKTAGVLTPLIIKWPGCAVVISTRPDLLMRTRHHRKSFAVFAPGEHYPGHRMIGYSPLDAITEAMRGLDKIQDHDDEQHNRPRHPEQDHIENCNRAYTYASNAANAMVSAHSMGATENGDMWKNAAADVLAPLLYIAATSPHLGMAAVVEWVSSGSAEHLVAQLPYAPDMPQQGIQHLEGFAAQDMKIISSVFITARTAIRAYTLPQALATTMAPDRIRPSMLVNDDASDFTLYIVGKPLDQETLAPLFVALISEITRAAYARSDEAMANMTADHNGPVTTDDTRLLLVLDESTNIVPLNNLDTLSSTGGGNGITGVIACQDFSQLRLMLGDAKAQTVMNNCQNRVIMGAIGDEQTLAPIVAMMGTHKVPTSSTTSGKDSNSTTRQMAEEPIMNSAQLRQLPEGDVIVISGNLPPIRARVLSPRPPTAPPGRPTAATAAKNTPEQTKEDAAA